MNRSLFLLAFLNLPLGAAEPVRFEYEEPHMGTKFRLVCYAADRAKADQAAKDVFARVAELNRIMSDYLPDSELSVLCAKNAQRPAGPIKVSPDLYTVLDRAERTAYLSEGAFDVSIGPVVRLWRQARKDRRLPDADVLKETLAKVGYKNIVLDAKAMTVELKIAGMQLDLGGIAKGYAADEGLKIFAKHGITAALVAASGDIAVSDAPPGKTGWRVEIGSLSATAPKRVLNLKQAAVSTSGDAEQFVEIAGVRYSHIVDPKTGLGLTGRRSVSVIAPRGITADSMTKMAMLLPPEKALQTIDKIKGAATLIVVKTATGEDVQQSKNFTDWLLKE